MLKDIDLKKQKYIAEEFFKYLEYSIKDIKLIKVFLLGDPEDYLSTNVIECRGVFKYKEIPFNITLVFNIKTLLYYYYIEVNGRGEIGEYLFNIERYGEDQLDDIHQILLNTIQLIIKIINNEEGKE